jgi:hypothetical protein
MVCLICLGSKTENFQDNLCIQWWKLPLHLLVYLLIVWRVPNALAQFVEAAAACCSSVKVDSRGGLVYVFVVYQTGTGGIAIKYWCTPCADPSQPSAQGF